MFTFYSFLFFASSVHGWLVGYSKDRMHQHWSNLIVDQRNFKAKCLQNGEEN